MVILDYGGWAWGHQLDDISKFKNNIFIKNLPNLSQNHHYVNSCKFLPSSDVLVIHSKQWNRSYPFCYHGNRTWHHTVVPTHRIRLMFSCDCQPRRHNQVQLCNLILLSSLGVPWAGKKTKRNNYLKVRNFFHQVLTEMGSACIVNCNWCN